MFLNKALSNNKALLDYAFKAKKAGLILPDSYILDLDAFIDNGKAMMEVAKREDVKLFFMLKQIGRNPIIAKELMKLGFAGCVAVDYKEALLMVDNGIPLGNVGHLVQIPHCAMKKIINSKPEVVTVYGREKIKEINETAKELGLVQPLMLRVMDENSHLYSGQVGGFKIEELEDALDYIESLSNVKLGGLTVFPALLFDEESEKIVPTPNMSAMNKAMKLVKERGYQDLLINLPSATCSNSIPLIRSLGGNNGEPGHGLSGTTPLHKASDEAERVAYCYVSEVSHNYEDKAYCYGGGHYRRGHMENVLVGKDLNSAKMLKVVAPDDDSIDYHYEISENCNVNDTCVMAHRTQIFTTRSNVVVVKGIGTDNPEIVGTFNSLGEEIKDNWH